MSNKRSFVHAISLAGMIAMTVWFACQCAGCLAPGLILRLPSLRTPESLIAAAGICPLGLIFPLLRMALYGTAYLLLKSQLNKEKPNSTALFTAVLAGIPALSLSEMPAKVLLNQMFAHLYGMNALSAYSTVSSVLAFTGVFHTVAVCALLAAVSVHWADTSRG